MQLLIPAPPENAKVVVANVWTISRDWFIWLSQELVSRVQKCSQVIKVPSALTGQSAAIGTTTLLTVATATIYRASGYLAITTADGVSSSVALTFRWTDGGVAKTKTFTALTGDTTATADGFTHFIHADAGTAVSYSTSYASNTPAKMRYRLDLALEQLN